jgi:uncharacterized membrane protein
MRRLEHVDLLRGLVMVVMVLDHARDYQAAPGSPGDPMDLSVVTPGLFLLRWLTHFCAPVFAFLMGVSVWLSCAHRPPGEASAHLVRRALLLYLLEFTLVDWGWTFNPFWPRKFFQVIAALATGLLTLSLFVRCRKEWALATGAAILLLHNLADGVRFAPDTAWHYAWSLLHQKNVLPLFGGYEFRTTYPVLPVIGVALCGYALADWVKTGDRKLRTLGWGLCALYLLLRLGVGYGDPHDFERQPGALQTLMSVFNPTKYPLSLQFVCMTLGPALVFLDWAGRRQMAGPGWIRTLGRAPMFFYVSHGWVLHVFALLWALAQGYTWAAIDVTRNYGGRPTGFGFPLLATIPFAAAAIAAIYPACRWWEGRKRLGRG